MAETLIPLEEREEERRPSWWSHRRERGAGWGSWPRCWRSSPWRWPVWRCIDTAAGEDDPQEPGERAESPTISYRDRELPVLEGVAVNSYVSDGFSVNDRGWLTGEQDGVLSALIGIDVSAYQGEIDWQQVADSGGNLQ